MTQETLTVTDNRTGRSFEVPIEDGAVRAADLTDPFDLAHGHGLTIYDPGFIHTAACRSQITTVEIETGTLRHRGYRIEELCEHATFIELAHLLINGELPTPPQLDRWTGEIANRKFVHENVQSFIAGFRYDAAPMVILSATVGAMSSFYSDASDVHDDAARERQVVRLLAKMPTLAAFAFRHSSGRPYIYPVDNLSFAGNALSMMFRMSELQYRPDPLVERALEVLLMLHADHEQNASTAAVRAVGSTHVNPYAAIAAGVAALSGPMRGGAAQGVLTMLRKIGSVDRVPSYLESVKTGDERLMGFGHWVYKTHDPRARVMRAQLQELYDHKGPDPLVEIADELVRVTAQDEYFVSRQIFPNLDLYSGLTYQAVGIPASMYGVMFAVARSAGWLAQWVEIGRASCRERVSYHV